jgi:hypothetical protein
MDCSNEKKSKLRIRSFEETWTFIEIHHTPQELHGDFQIREKQQKIKYLRKSDEYNPVFFPFTSSKSFMKDKSEFYMID